MNQFFKAHKKEIFLFLLMLILELAMIFVLSQKNGLNIFSRSDGNEYQNIVENLINRQIFSLDGSAPYLSTNFRTPIYPFWLAVIYLIFGSFKPAIFIGAAIFALSAPVVYLIAREIFTEKIAFVSAILFAVEPWTLFQSGFLIAEQIFFPVFLLSIYLFCRYLKTGTTRFIYWTSLVLGITTLIRPLSTFFILIFVFFTFIAEFKFSIKRALKISLLSLLVFILILSPWLIRNKIALNTWQISSISNVSLYVENYEMLETYLGKMRPGEDINEKASALLGARDHGYESAKRLVNSKILASVALEEIKSNIGSYIAMHLGKLPSFLLRNSYANIFLDLKIPGSSIQSNIGRNLLSKDFAGLFSLVKNAPIGSKILIVLAFFWPFVITLAIIGIFVKFKDNPKNLFLWFLILWIGYFLVLTGNLRDISRYKLAINAPLFMFAIFGVYRIYNFLKIHSN